MVRLCVLLFFVGVLCLFFFFIIFLISLFSYGAFLSPSTFTNGRSADDGAFDKFLWIAGMPFVCLFTVTVPDCSKTKGEKYYMLTFLMSIAWIGGLCTGMVQAATWIGCILGIDPIVMGITLLAVGTSVPDALGSMIVARAGEADMAIANAVGSNVFDILLGLGFPWMLRGKFGFLSFVSSLFRYLDI